MNDKQISRKATTALKRAGVAIFGGKSWSTRVLGEHVYINWGSDKFHNRTEVLSNLEAQGFEVTVEQLRWFITVDQFA